MEVIYLIGSASNYYIGGNDEHGLSPPTLGKRTPIMPYIDRSFYENEFNRSAKNYFLAACMRCGFSVYDVKPEITDIPVSTRVARINSQNLTLVVTFGYNAYGDGVTFNSASGYTVYYSPANVKPSASRLLSYDISSGLQEFLSGRNRGVSTLYDVGVLSSVNCTSSLAETGFMTNFTEAKQMLDPDFAKATGEGAALGVCNYLGVDYVSNLNVSSLLTVKKGSYNMYVKYLQLMLKTLGYEVDADGAFGTQTENAVKKYQSDNGLVSDGIVGQNTWNSILYWKNPLPVLSKGSSGKYVRYLQLKLLSDLYNIGTIDGDFGSQTENAVKQFQEENELTPDGIVGPLTWAKLAPIGGGRPLP
jgi:peptidoglycan hydrolase-like protein with peptidoglycan-binding domain